MKFTNQSSYQMTEGKGSLEKEWHKVLELKNLAWGKMGLGFKSSSALEQENVVS